MLNFKLHPAPHQRLISWAAAPGFAILMVEVVGGGGGYICVHSLSFSYMMKQKMNETLCPFLYFSAQVQL